MPIAIGRDAGSERSRTLHPGPICYGNNPTPPHRLYRPPPELPGGRDSLRAARSARSVRTTQPGLLPLPVPAPRRAYCSVPFLTSIYSRAQGGGPSCRNPPVRSSKADTTPDRPLCLFHRNPVWASFKKWDERKIA